MKNFNEVKKYIIIADINNIQDNLYFINEYKMTLFIVKNNKKAINRYYIKLEFNNNVNICEATQDYIDFTLFNIAEKNLKDADENEILYILALIGIDEYNKKYNKKYEKINNLDIFNID